MAHLYYFLLDWNISAYIEMNRAGNLMIEVMNDTSLIHEKCIYIIYKWNQHGKKTEPKT